MDDTNVPEEIFDLTDGTAAIYEVIENIVDIFSWKR